MFKLIVVTLLSVLAFNSCADISIMTGHVPLTSTSYVFYSINGHHDYFTVDAKLPLYTWSN